MQGFCFFPRRFTQEGKMALSKNCGFVRALRNAAEFGELTAAEADQWRAAVDNVWGYTLRRSGLGGLGVETA
jgi:hypothetical protein